MREWKQSHSAALVFTLGDSERVRLTWDTDAAGWQLFTPFDALQLTSPRLTRDTISDAQADALAIYTRQLRKALGELNDSRPGFVWLLFYVHNNVPGVPYVYDSWGALEQSANSYIQQHAKSRLTRLLSPTNPECTFIDKSDRSVTVKALLRKIANT
jgi:hypothetical protein